VDTMVAEAARARGLMTAEDLFDLPLAEVFA
jgi:hypothetical protein